ncbi:MAG: methyltransferase domain-containing protein [Proteobacteria bacterium]|nr:methyltransferase domain-containing protein [Pseudomonadota bacterium]
MSRKLHIGGIEKAQGWEILNAIPAPNVDHLGDAKDLSQFPDNTFTDIYASHVVEHLDYANNELLNALKEWYRVLAPGGTVYISVPDMDALSRMFIEKDKHSLNDQFMIMRMMFGGHMDKYDYHVVGLNQGFLVYFLHQAGYTNIRRVESLGIFQDTSCLLFKGMPISVNMLAQKPA